VNFNSSSIAINRRRFIITEIIHWRHVLAVLTAPKPLMHFLHKRCGVLSVRCFTSAQQYRRCASGPLIFHPLKGQGHSSAMHPCA
jgi:hypothetical protein